MPYHSIHVARGLLLDGSKQVIGAAGQRCLRMPTRLGGSYDTSQEQRVLAVLRRSKVMKGPDPATASGKRAEHVIRQVMRADIHCHCAKRVAMPVAIACRM
jgi:hypothetical protein